MNYTLKKVTNPGSVYPPPAYKVMVNGEEIGTLYKIPKNWYGISSSKHFWKFEASKFGFSITGPSIKLIMGNFFKFGPEAKESDE
jgi:hypothetical protein